MRIYGLLLLLLLDLVCTHSPGFKSSLSRVFLSQEEAQQVLVRQRRANSFLEELKPANLERECVEEICNYEEALEIFETKELTNKFWTKYVDGDACESAPCQNQGNCTDTVGGFSCDCVTGFRGLTCDEVIPMLCDDQNGGCEHFCDAEHGAVQCSCADGYFLASDNRTCQSSEPFKCGAVITNHTYHTRTVHDHNQTLIQTQDPSGPNRTNPVHSPVQRLFAGYECPAGECPWQALLLDEDHKGFCGGTILTDIIILTSASCMNQSRYISVLLGESDTQVDSGNEAVHQVEMVVVHQKFRRGTRFNDIALIKLTSPIRFNRYMLPACLPTKDFAEKVLMQEPYGLVSGFRHLGKFTRPSSSLQRLAVPFVGRLQCLESMALWISTRSFCAGYDRRHWTEDACQGDLGGPHVTRYRETYFITGITSWGQGCGRSGEFTVYTQVSKYLAWIQEAIRALASQSPSQNQDPVKRKRSSGPPPPQDFRSDQDPPRSKRNQSRPQFTILSL